MRAFLFPGQGSQSVGMGKALADASPAALELFQEVDDALSQHLFRIMVEGPESDLTLTENAQPAIMANALATLRVMQREGGFSLSDKGDYVAGHSLGEYSALCAVEAFDITTTSRLLNALISLANWPTRSHSTLSATDSISGEVSSRNATATMRGTP